MSRSFKITKNIDGRYSVMTKRFLFWSYIRGKDSNVLSFVNRRTAEVKIDELMDSERMEYIRKNRKPPKAEPKIEYQVILHPSLFLKNKVN